ncbi:MAG: hypothetical protein ACTS73_00875 [Arsenophonus sp. NEOnobi-MAG3]
MSVTDIGGLVYIVQYNNIGFTIVVLETTLILSIVDTFQHVGLMIFASNENAGQLEGSKLSKKIFTHIIIF